MEEKKTLEQTWDQVAKNLKQVKIAPVKLELNNEVPILKDKLADEDLNLRIVALCLTGAHPLDCTSDGMKSFQDKFIQSLISVKMTNVKFDDVIRYFDNPSDEPLQQEIARTLLLGQAIKADK